MFEECEECKRLWSEYQETARCLLKVVSDLQIATLRHDKLAVEQLEPRHSQEEVRHAAVREALRSHQKTHRSDSAER